MNDMARCVKFRRAPSGKVYVVWRGRPICDEDGGLRYFDSEQDARDTLEHCDTVLRVPAHDADTEGW